MKRRIAPALLFACWPLWTSCGGSEPAEEGAPAEGGASAELEAEDAPAPVERRDIDPAATGSVRGRVTYSGEAKEPAVLSQIPKQPGCQHGHDEEPRSEFMLVQDGGLQNAFVSVSKGLEAWNVPAAPAEPVVLEQRGCIYRPHVQGLQVGQTLLVTNDDTTNHNVNCQSKRIPFNINQGPGAPDREVEFEHKEWVRFKCDIHPWMSAYVGIAEHPFFDVSEADGSFEITGLPAGTYELEAVHENTKIGRRGKVKATVEVVAGGTAEVELRFDD